MMRNMMQPTLITVNAHTSAAVGKHICTHGMHTGSVRNWNLHQSQDFGNIGNIAVLGVCVNSKEGDPEVQMSGLTSCIWHRIKTKTKETNSELAKPWALLAAGRTWTEELRVFRLLDTRY